MKKVCIYLGKCFVAGIISIIILCMFSMVYYNPPIHVTQPKSITNSRFVPNSNWSYMIEGAGYGKIDNSGYNNAYYDDLSEPDIVFMGSSHLESLQVPEQSNFIYLLNRKFDEDDLSYNNYKCLNLGVSGHFLNVSACNFEYVVNEFPGAKYVVIEASDVKFSPSDLDKINNGEFHSPIEERSTIYKIAQKIPYLRLLLKKIQDMSAVKNNNNDTLNDGSAKTNEQYDIDVYKEKMSVVLEKLSTISDENGVELIIVMHERFYLDENGDIAMEKEQEYKNAFKECCERYDITVVDVLPEMIENYENKLELPYGFSNTTPGTGHLNKVGHRIIADALYKEINGMEETK